MNFSSANDAKQAELKLKQFRKSLEIKRKYTAEFDAGIQIFCSTSHILVVYPIPRPSQGPL